MPGEKVAGPSLVNYDNNYLYLSGGHVDSVSSLKVRRFSIEKSEWTESPDLNQSRYNHSSCVLSGTLYVFGGYCEESKWIASMESLNVREDVKETQAVIWI